MLASGTTNLQANSTLTVYVNNQQQLVPNSKWPVILDNDKSAIVLPNQPPNFVMPLTTDPQTNLGDKVDPKNPYQYIVTS